MKAPFSALLLVVALYACDLPRDEPSISYVGSSDGHNVQVLDTSLYLPKTAVRIWISGEISDRRQRIRFEAPIEDARRFLGQLLEAKTQPGDDPHIYTNDVRLHWWLRHFPPGAEGGRSRGFDPAVHAVILPQGSRATVWLLTFDV